MNLLGLTFRTGSGYIPEMLLFLLHILCTLLMTGLIWFVQVVHYPLFAKVAAEDFAAYEKAHGKATFRIVAPVMLGEAFTGLALLVFPPEGLTYAILLPGLLLVPLLFACTFYVQMPLHLKLTAAFKMDLHRKLVRTNWWRTGMWSLRSLWALACLYLLLNGL